MTLITFSSFSTKIYRIWHNGGREKTDSRRAQFPTTNRCNRSRSWTAGCTEYARDGLGRWTRIESTNVGKWMHFCSWPKPIFGWVNMNLFLLSCQLNREFWSGDEIWSGVLWSKSGKLILNDFWKIWSFQSLKNI
jgi:hypothetical protein